ncbi:MAG: hypothetical protein ACRCSF_06170 [Mycobacteriaceae bacterium]
MVNSEQWQKYVLAAFGPAPNGIPVQPPVSAVECWLLAVAYGGQGRYASARALLTQARGSADPIVVSLATSTEASFLRQLGRHNEARGLDGRALHAVSPLEGIGDQSFFLLQAQCDALTGLAADALGVGRFGLSQRLLDRVEQRLPYFASEEVWRARLRLHWVRAEWAMASGDPTLAQEQARIAMDLADAGVSVRHQVKSSLILAAALSASGAADQAEAQELGYSILEQAGQYLLVPLQWAATMLVEGIGLPSHAEISMERVLHIRRECVKKIQHWGGKFAPTEVE